jgi:hypothetical protein
VKRALAHSDGAITPPTPHWLGLRLHERQQKLARLEKLRRVRRPSDAEVEQIARLQKELGIVPFAIDVTAPGGAEAA